MNRNDIEWKTDVHGITFALRKEGLKTCERIYDMEQYELVLDTLKQLAVFAKARIEEQYPETAPSAEA